MSDVHASCPVCAADEYEQILSLGALPVLVNAQVRPDAACDVPRGEMSLAVCHRCGHLFNPAFDEQLMAYDASYENTLHFSGQFQKFAAELCDRLIADHELHGADVAELGSGPGHFLSMLCTRGVGRGLGFDPSYDPDRLGAPDHPSVTVTSEPFPGDGSLQVRLAFSQHVLEHLSDPVAALEAQRGAVRIAAGSVYTEVPNGQLMLDQCALWDLIYEHRSYFVPASLDLACRRAGLSVTSMGTEFGDQFLWCEASSADRSDDATIDAAAADVAVAAARAFGTHALERIDVARTELHAAVARGPVALWGAGSKGVTYLNLVADVAAVAAVIDINPRKDGWGVPGTSQVISSPQSLLDIDPATVLVANPVYVQEITEQLDALGVSADVRALWGDDT